MFLIVVTFDFFSIGNCLKCSDENTVEKCECCCKPEEKTDDKCCPEDKNPADHICYECDTGTSVVLEDKIVPSNTNLPHNHISADRPLENANADLNLSDYFILQEYPESNHTILSITTILRI